MSGSIPKELIEHVCQTFYDHGNNPPDWASLELTYFGKLIRNRHLESMEVALEEFVRSVA